MSDDLEPDCVFCRIIRGEDEADRILETETTLAFAPMGPAVRGHTLVIPKAHVTDFLSAPLGLFEAVMSTTRVVANAVGEALRPEGFNLITSAGRAASQTVFHLHVHVVPRWEDDRMGDLWPPKSTYLEETKDDVAAVIRQALRRAGHPAED